METTGRLYVFEWLLDENRFDSQLNKVFFELKIVWIEVLILKEQYELIYLINKNENKNTGHRG